MVIDVAEHKAGSGFVDDDADVHINADGPEAGVFCLVEFMEAEAGAGWVEL
ncbi:hypothetical protein SPB21_11585 [Leptothoe sp. ISB3NOV94-8A]